MASQGWAGKRTITAVCAAGACLAAGIVLMGSRASAQAAAPRMDPALYRHVCQVGWVVKDLDSVVDYWEKLGLRNIRRAGVMSFPDAVYRGRRTALRMKTAYGDIGGVQMEWIEPVKGYSVYNEFLAKHGDGVQHLAYQMPSPVVMDEQIAYFKSRGVDVVQSGTWQGGKGTGRYAYLDTARETGVAIELTYNPDWPMGGEAPRANEYPFNNINHYGFVVANVRGVSAYWQRIGFGALDIVHNVSLDREYHGRPGRFEMDLGWNRRGDRPFEWVESTEGPNDYVTFLKNRGPGLQHLGFSVTDMDAAIRHFKALGLGVTMSGAWDIQGDQGRFAYLATDPHGGVTIELIWNQPRAQSRGELKMHRAPVVYCVAAGAGTC